MRKGDQILETDNVVKYQEFEAITRTLWDLNHLENKLAWREFGKVKQAGKQLDLIDWQSLVVEAD